MRTLLQPKVIIPAVISIGLLAALLLTSNFKRVVGIMQDYPHLYLFYYLLLMVAYEVIRGVQWHFLLTKLGVHVPMRAQIFSFALGEMTKSLPIGNYFQNYVLQQVEGVDFGRTSAASTLIILIEVLASCAGIVVLGLGAWTTWLRVFILGGIFVALLVIVLAKRLHIRGRLPARLRDHKAMQQAASEFHQFQEGVRILLRVDVLVVAMVLGFTYVTIAGFALYLVVLGIGAHGLNVQDALAVYYFSLAFSLIFPLPIDLGVAELSGVGAFAAVGYEHSYAVGTMLVNRALSLGSAIAIALLVVLVLHDELLLALRGGDDHGHGSATALQPHSRRAEHHAGKRKGAVRAQD